MKQTKSMGEKDRFKKQKTLPDAKVVNASNQQHTP